MVAFWSLMGQVWPRTLAPPYQDTLVMEKQSWKDADKHKNSVRKTHKELKEVDIYKERGKTAVRR